MKKNILLKSVLRQPIRTLILLILIGAAAFAFVARASEFIVISGELNRVEAFYRKYESPRGRATWGNMRRYKH